MEGEAVHSLPRVRFSVAVAVVVHHSGDPAFVVTGHCAADDLGVGVDGFDGLAGGDQCHSIVITATAGGVRFTHSTVIPLVPNLILIHAIAKVPGNVTAVVCIGHQPAGVGRIRLAVQIIVAVSQDDKGLHTQILCDLHNLIDSDGHRIVAGSPFYRYPGDGAAPHTKAGLRGQIQLHCGVAVVGGEVVIDVHQGHIAGFGSGEHPGEAEVHRLLVAVLVNGCYGESEDTIFSDL